MNYQVLRNFDAANKAVDRGLELNPQGLGLWEMKSRLAVAEKGDFGVYEGALEKIKSFPISIEERVNMIRGEANFLVLQRKYDRLLQLGINFRTMHLRQFRVHWP